METPERIEVINQRLIDHIGLYIDGQPYMRVVWSEDQMCKRWTNHSREGFELPYKMLVEAPKYRQWIHHKWILEKLTEVPAIAQDEANGKISYEPLWVFEDNQGNALPPKWEAIVVILNTLQENIERAESGGVKYPDTENNPASIEERIAILYEQLYGNDTDISDALSWKSGVSLVGLDGRSYKDRN